MILRPRGATRTRTLCPYTTPFRMIAGPGSDAAADDVETNASLGGARHRHRSDPGVVAGVRRGGAAAPTRRVGVRQLRPERAAEWLHHADRKSTRLNSSH